LAGLNRKRMLEMAEEATVDCHGEDEPYEKLKRALRAEVAESAWQALYSPKSRPFPVPSTGKIAVKVINHYGDEVLKVVEVKS
jgi:adenine-specific DNA-methyltransferase